MYYGQGSSGGPYDHYPDHSVADIPDVIKDFIQYFHNSIKEGRLYEIQDLYENT